MDYLLNTFLPKDWVFSKLSYHTSSIDRHDWDNLYMGSLCIISLAMNTIVMLFTAKHVCDFIGVDASRYAGVGIGSLKLILMWYVFAVTYIALFLLLFMCVPEIWLYRKLSDYTGSFIGEILWDSIHMSLLLVLALLFNGLVIFLMTSFAIKLLRELKRWRRSPSSN
jgi:hypothetical protein